MDLTTLSFLLAVFVAALGVDTALHPSSVVIDTAVPAKFTPVEVDPATVSDILASEVAAISSTPSVEARPEIRVGGVKGIGMAIAEATSIKPVALALQREMGYRPKTIKLSLISEDSKIKVIVSGGGLDGHIQTAAFQQVVTQQPGEDLVQLVRRGAIVGLGKIDPYFTSLYLVQNHASDGDFSEASTLIANTVAALPPTPQSPDLAHFLNLQGIIALFKGDALSAHDLFLRAADADPDNAVVWLNAAFADLQLDTYHDAVEHARDAAMVQPPPEPTLLATAYMTWGAALVGLKDIAGADQMLAKSLEINPSSSTAPELWSEIKRLKGDSDAADRLHRLALQNSSDFENYTEVAALWFQLAWKDNQAVSRNKFGNPAMLRLNR